MTRALGCGAMFSASLSESQKLIWVNEQISPHTSMNVICGAALIGEKIDTERLKAAVTAYIAQTSAFHVILEVSRGEPRQCFADLPPVVEIHDLSDQADARAALSSFGETCATRPFSLSDGPLYFAALLRLAGDKTALLLSAHHLIADAFSVFLFLRAVAKNYRALGIGAPIPNAGSSFSALLEQEARYLSSEQATVDREFWNAELARLGDGTLLGGRELLDVPTHGRRFTREWPAELSRQFVEKRGQTGTWAGVLSLLGGVVGKILGAPRVCIGSPYFNRKNPTAIRTFGMCVNSLPVVVEPGIELERCLEHGRYPLLRQNTPAGRRLFDVGFSLQNADFSRGVPLPIDSFEWFFPKHELNALTVHMHDRAGAGALRFDLDYRTAIFSEEQISAIFRALTESAEELVENKPPRRRTSLDAARGKKPERVASRLQRAFEQFGDRVAVFEENRAEMSYRRVEEESRRIAERLRGEGIGPGSLVLVEASRSQKSILDILGIIRAGAAWVPLPAAIPPSRRALICEKIERARKEGISSELAYVLFTSGSTGQPKGVAVGHDAFAHYLDFAVAEYSRGRPTNMPLFTSLGFDLTLTSIFVPLLSGGVLSVFPESLDDEGLTLPVIFAADRSDAIKLTPSHLRLIDSLELSSRRPCTFIIGGEALPNELVERVARRFPAGSRFINEYGPTEAVVGCVIHEYTPEDGIVGQAPIGRPIPGTEIRLMTSRGEEQLPGFKGEIQISGPGLAEGYLGEPGQTEAKFYFADGLRWYRSGDLAIEQGGNLHYLGRVDRQIKRNGHRIELSELEGVLPDSRAIYLAEEKQLLLFVAGEDCPEAERLRVLADHLPAAALPNAIVSCASMPLNAHGKIDDGALLAIWRSAPRPSAFLEELDPSATRVIALSAELLRGEASAAWAASQSFIAAGGDSIAAIQVVARLQNEGLRLSVAELMTAESIAAAAQLARREDSSDPAGDAEPAAEIDGAPLPLLPMAAWYFGQELAEPHHYHQSLLLELQTPLDTSAAERALAQVVAVHDALRINLREDGTLAVNANAAPRFEVLPVPATASQQDFIRGHTTRIKQSLDLRKDSLIQAAYFPAGEQNYLFMCAHHLGVDVASWFIILDDFLRAHRGATLVRPRTTIRAWAEVLDRFSAKSSGEYWANIRDCAERAQIAPRYSAQEITSYEESTSLPALAAPELHRRYATEPQELLLAALAAAAAAHFGTTRIFALIETHGRHSELLHRDVSRTVGWLSGQYPLVLEVGTADELIRRAKDNMRSVPDRGLGWPRFEKPLLRPTLKLNYLGRALRSPGGEFALSTLETGPDISPKNNPAEIIEAIAEDDAGTPKLRLKLDARWFDRADAARFVAELRRAADMIRAACDGDAPRIFTPTDFSTVRLSANDLSVLFGS